MRISDWSSDVCSSDLLAVDRDRQRRPRGNAQSLAGKAHRVVVPRLQAQRARHPVLEQAALERSDHRLDDDLARIDPRKIGRATCRDRVGQYVQISVVAASLKTKKKQHKTSTSY